MSPTLASLEPPGVLASNASEGDKKTVAFPAMPALARQQDMMVELALRGMTYEEIAQIIGVDVRKVSEYAASDYFVGEITKKAQASKASTPDSARSLMHVVGFAAVARLMQLVQSKAESIAIQACKLALDHSLAPAKLSDLRRKDLMGTPDDARKELEQIRKKQEQLAKTA